MKSKFKSVVTEVTLLTLLVMVLVLSFFFWLGSRWLQDWVLGEARRGLVLASDTLHSGLRHGMMMNQREFIESTIQRVASNTRIQKISIIDHRGSSVLSSVQQDQAAREKEKENNCRLCHDHAHRKNMVPKSALQTRITVEGTIMRSITPILAEPGCINGQCHPREINTGMLGIIDLTLSLDEVNQALSQSRKQLIILTMGMMLLGGGLFWVVLNRVLRRPLDELLRGIRRVAAGDLDYRLPQGMSNEFGELADSFNHMNTQLLTLHQGLVQSERLISMGKLAAGVAHEINNPLTGILAFGEDLLEDAEPDDPRKKDYEVIVHEALRCREIVRNLLDFARQGAPRLALVNLNDIFRKAVDVVSRQEAFYGVKFTWELASDLPPVKVDPVQIQQVMVNLIVNAQEAMPDGGTITLSSSSLEQPCMVEFSVRDTGSGIDPDLRQRIFEPFFSTKGGKTNGLGLAVCLGIIQQHGGRITLDSQPKAGTVFRVSLPCEADR